MSKQRRLPRTELRLVTDSSERELVVKSAPVSVQAGQTGFPSPAGDYEEDNLEVNLSEHLQLSHPATYVWQVTGDSMDMAHMPAGSYVITRKTLEMSLDKTRINGKVIACFLNGERLLKRFKLSREKGQEVFSLHSESSNPGHRPIRLSNEDDFIVWGVVTHSIVTVE